MNRGKFIPLRTGEETTPVATCEDTFCLLVIDTLHEIELFRRHLSRFRSVLVFPLLSLGGDPDFLLRRRQIFRSEAYRLKGVNDSLLASVWICRLLKILRNQ